MLPADCRVKIEMDDYGEGACGEASESLVRGRTQREPAAVEKDDFSRIVRSADCPWPPQDGDRHGGAFLTSSPMSIKTPRYTASPAAPRTGANGHLSVLALGPHLTLSLSPLPVDHHSQQLGPQPRPSLSPCPPPGLTLVGPSRPQALLPSPNAAS
ncbi:unnamed protein product [Gadus morhua 'NCC']